MSALLSLIRETELKLVGLCTKLSLPIIESNLIAAFKSKTKNFTAFPNHLPLFAANELECENNIKLNVRAT